MSKRPSYRGWVRSCAEYLCPAITTVEPKSTARGAATVVPTTGSSPDAVTPRASGPQQALQWQYAVMMATYTLVFISIGALAAAPIAFRSVVVCWISFRRESLVALAALRDWSKSPVYVVLSAVVGEVSHALNASCSSITRRLNPRGRWLLSNNSYRLAVTLGQ